MCTSLSWWWQKFIYAIYFSFLLKMHSILVIFLDGSKVWFLSASELVPTLQDWPSFRVNIIVSSSSHLTCQMVNFLSSCKFLLLSFCRKGTPTIFVTFKTYLFAIIIRLSEIELSIMCFTAICRALDVEIKVSSMSLEVSYILQASNKT